MTLNKRILLLLVTAMLSGYSYAQFSYTLITNGLTDIYEGGMTEFAVGDIDNDGDLDIVSVGDHSSPLIPSEHGIMVFKNNGNGTSWIKTMNGDFGYGGVALGDVNNDGFMDVAYGVHHNYSATDFGNQVLEVVLGDGTANNWVVYDDNLGLQGQSWGMSGCDFGDINNDGLLDLGANAFGCCDGVWLYKNNGDGSWDTYGGALNLNSSGQFRFADFNRDGLIDFIANNTQFNNQLYQIWMNLGNGQFVPMQTGIPFSDDYFMFDIADVNLDGAPDIALTYYGVPSVYTFDIANSTWVSTSSGLPTTNQNLWTLAVNDMDADGFIDLVTIKNNLITIYKGDGAGNWVQAATITTTETICRDLKLADFDHNGLPDVAYWGEYNGLSLLRVYLNNAVTTETWIKPVSPIGGETYCHGSVQFIRWKTRIPSGTSSTVNLELSTTGNAGPFTTIAANLPNNGTYQWIVPGLQSNDCFIKYTVNTSSSTYSETNFLPFTIDTCGNAYIIPGPVTGNNTICPGTTNTYTVPLIANCTGYTWTLPPGWTGSSITNSIIATAGNQGGMISVVAIFPSGNSVPQTLYVSLTQIDTSVVQSGLTLTAQETPATYQWYDCINSININGAVSQIFTPTQNGSYAVIITKNSCVDTSSCHQVIVTGLIGNKIENQVKISPNPTDGKILISCSIVMDRIELYDVLGKRLISLENHSLTEHLDLSILHSGLYFIKIKSNNNLIFKQIIKTQ